MVFDFDPYRVDIDVERTRRFYETAPCISQSCTCDGCRNFETAVDLLPSAVTSFFSSLGVDLKRVREVYTLYGIERDTVYYGGFCHLCGTLLAGEECSKEESIPNFPVTSDLQIFFRADCQLPEEDLPEPSLQLEFFLHVPWVLAEENSYYEKSLTQKKQKH